MHVDMTALSWLGNTRSVFSISPQTLLPNAWLHALRQDHWFWSAWTQGDFLRAWVEHVDLCLITLLIASLIAFPIGFALSRFRGAANFILPGLGVLYTIPSLALLALLVPFWGLGSGTAIIALVLYAQFILIRHVMLGLTSIDPLILESARGMGMTPWQLFVKIQWPLALPIWLCGIRLALLSTIGIATIAAWIHAGGLGVLIFDGLTQNNLGKILLGALLIVSLSFWSEHILQNFETAARERIQGEVFNA